MISVISNCQDGQYLYVQDQAEGSDTSASAGIDAGPSFFQ